MKKYMSFFYIAFIYALCLIAFVFIFRDLFPIKISHAKTEKAPLECYNPGTVFGASMGSGVNINGHRYSTYSSKGVPTALMVPNAEGTGYVKIPIKEPLAPSEDYLDAQEVRLKVREMASQLLETWPFSSIDDMVAYVTTFTPQDDLTKATPFGQYLRDAFIYEFNNRGFAVRDYSARDLIINQGGFGFGVSDGTYATPVVGKRTALITGTFYRDEKFLFINVRLVRGSDGMVLRTAQTLFPVTPLVARMVGKDYNPDPEIIIRGPILSAGGLPIVPGVIGKNVK